MSNLLARSLYNSSWLPLWLGSTPNTFENSLADLFRTFVLMVCHVEVDGVGGYAC